MKPKLDPRFGSLRMFEASRADVALVQRGHDRIVVGYSPPFIGVLLRELAKALASDMVRPLASLFEYLFRHPDEPDFERLFNRFTQRIAWLIKRTIEDEFSKAAIRAAAEALER